MGHRQATPSALPPPVPVGPESNLGRVLGGAYKIIGRIGEGGMGTVYRAVQLVVGRDVAVKMLRTSHIPPAQLIVATDRFRREATVTSRLQHPNTVRMFDFGETPDGELYLVLELLEGRSLADRIDSAGPLHPALAVRLCEQVARSLAEAHRVGVVHRDLKPDNIFLCPVDGERDFVKVMDFGVARLTAPETDGKTRLTADFAVVGSAHYMSPEQAEGLPVEASSDLYALGVLLYECLTGEPPFDGATELQVMMAHIHDPVPPVDIAETVPAPIAAGLRSLLASLLAKEPDERPDSADTVAGELAWLAELCEGEGFVPAEVADKRATTQLLRRVDPRQAPTMSVIRRIPGEPAPGRGRWKWTLVAALALIVGVVAGGLILAQPPARRVVVMDAPTGPLDPPSLPALRAETTTPTPAPEPAPPKTTIALSTTPPGATASIGSSLLCETPCAAELDSAPDGAVIILRHPGFEDADVAVELPPGQRKEYTVALRRLPEPEPHVRPEPEHAAKDATPKPSSKRRSRPEKRRTPSLLPGFRATEGARTLRQ